MPDNAAPLILLTRPRAASERFAEELRSEIGPVRVVIAPLLEIRTLVTSLDLDGVAALIFTSAAGVSVFANLTERRDLAAWCVGNRTAQAAREIGLRAHSADGDADALVAMMSEARPSGRILHLHGTQVRGQIAERLCDAGLRVEGHPIYDQEACPADAAFEAALAGPDPAIVPLFSPRSASLFAEAVATMALGPVHLVALSPAVAQALPKSFEADRLTTAARPDADALICAIRDTISP